MPRKNSYLTATDQFCGAGGSSQGATKAGIEVKLALNHWKLAIETHNTNFPDTAHDCTDIQACDPRRYPSTDILITSPECTNHSLAKGQKQVKTQMEMFISGKIDAAAERSRATMWDVPRFAEYHRYNAIIVENVVDARKWVMFDAWLQAMRSLGYLHKCVYLNSQHCHPTPQSRDRMYIVFWKKGNKAPDLDYKPLAYCPRCEKDVFAVQTFKRPDVKFGKYKQQYVYCCPQHGTTVEPYYYSAFNVIDWSDIGIRIGDRKKPLSENTERRIRFGLNKYGTSPYILHSAYSKEARGVVRSALDTAFTQTTLQSQAIVQPFIMPMIGKGEHTMNEGYIKSAAEAFQTQTVRQSMFVVTPPFIVESKGTSNSKGITDPLACVTTKSYHGLITSSSWNSFIHYNYGQTTLSHVNEPLGTATTKERHSLITYQQPAYEDCYYRMLKPNEIKLAMAFGQDYIVLGSGKDQVKQLGNAVTPPAMEFLVSRVKESLS